jgi:Sel1 repeat
LVVRPTNSNGIVVRSLVFAGTVLVGSALLLWPSGVAADSLAEARSVLKQQDFATAHAMFELEARRGNAAAMNELGYLYLRGHGVPQDCKRAYMWFSLAIGFAPDEALRREAVDNQFTAEVNGGLKSRDKSDAHRLGNVWLARYHLE